MVPSTSSETFTPDVLRLMMNMVKGEQAVCVTGNHEKKLLRKLRGKDEGAVEPVSPGSTHTDGQAGCGELVPVWHIDTVLGRGTNHGLVGPALLLARALQHQITCTCKD